MKSRARVPAEFLKNTSSALVLVGCLMIGGVVLAPVSWAQEEVEVAPADDVMNEPASDTLSGVQPTEPPANSGLYYDSNNVMIPGSDLPGSAPRKVDPKFEPAQKYVVVEKNASASSQEATLIAANRALKLGRYASAMEMFEQLYKRSKRDPRILMGLAVAQQESGFTESAIRTYEELLMIQPRNVEAKVNMLGLMQDRYPAVALRKLKDLWEENPRNAGVAAQIGLASASQGQNEDAIRFLGIAASLEPGNAGHMYNMAVIADRMGAGKQAIEFYEKALEVDASNGGSAGAPRQAIYDRLAVLRRQ